MRRYRFKYIIHFLKHIILKVNLLSIIMSSIFLVAGSTIVITANDIPTEKSADSNTPVIHVPYINQSSYPTGCEITSATMLLHFYGYTYSVDTMIDKYLDKESISVEDGTSYSGDPNKVFIGDPYSAHGYGCYAPVITNSLNHVLTNNQIAKNTTGMSLANLTTKYIDNNIPVLIWASINMVKTYPTAAWTLKGSNEVVYWPTNEHCLVLIGYDDDYYYVNDPYDNNGVVGYKKKDVKQRFSELNCQSVVITQNDNIEKDLLDFTIANKLQLTKPRIRFAGNWSLGFNVEQSKSKVFNVNKDITIKNQQIEDITIKEEIIKITSVELSPLTLKFKGEDKPIKN